MFTPQQIEEHSFVKAVFGGYDMQSVNDFLTPLVEDYASEETKEIGFAMIERELEKIPTWA